MPADSASPVRIQPFSGPWMRAGGFGCRAAERELNRFHLDIDLVVTAEPCSPQG